MLSWLLGGAALAVSGRRILQDAGRRSGQHGAAPPERLGQFQNTASAMVVKDLPPGEPGVKPTEILVIAAPVFTSSYPAEPVPDWRIPREEIDATGRRRWVYPQMRPLPVRTPKPQPQQSAVAMAPSRLLENPWATQPYTPPSGAVA